MNTLVLLIDFEGHPVLGNDYINNLRYSTLIDIIHVENIDTRNIIFVSNSADEKLNEIKNLALSKGLTWVDVDNNASVSSLIKFLNNKYNFICHRKKTHVIFGGTNTSGCVLGGKAMGLRSWAKAKYKCTLYFPLCAEYYVQGINEIDKIMHSMTAIYKSLKEHDIVNLVDLVSEKENLSLPIEVQYV